MSTPVFHSYENIQADVQSIAQALRDSMTASYPNGLAGHCIEASDRLAQALQERGLSARTVEGWFRYDDESYGSDRPWDEHTWVEVDLPPQTQSLFVDVTLDQFQPGMDEPIAAVVIGDRPSFLVLEEPTFEDEPEWVMPAKAARSAP